MIYIVDIAYVLGKAIHIVNGSVDVVSDNVLGDKLIRALFEGGEDGLLVFAALLKNFGYNAVSYLFAYADFLKLFGLYAFGKHRERINHAV